MRIPPPPHPGSGHCAADKCTGAGEERAPTTRGGALPEKLGVPRRREVEEEYLSPVGATTRRSRPSLPPPPATRGLVPSLSPGCSAARRAASVPSGAPRGGEGGAARGPLSLQRPAEGPLRVQRGGSARSLPALGLLPWGQLRGPRSPRQPGLCSRSPVAAKAT